MKLPSKIILIFLSILITNNISAQVVDWMSPYAYGSYGIAVDEFENSYSLSQYGGTIDIDGTMFTSEGNQDEIIVKHDPNGNVLWASSIGGTESDWAGEIVYDGLGNVWVTGQFSGTFNAGSHSITTNGSEDAYLVKIDAATGTPLYASNGGGSSANDDGNAITTDGMGNIFVIGDCASSNFDWGGLTMSVSGSNDVFVIKFDNAGTPLWISKCTGTSSEFTYAGTADQAGNVYVCAYTGSGTLNINGNPYTTGTNDHFVTKFDANGTEVWTNMFDGGGNSYDMAADDWGNVYFTLSGGPGQYGPFTVSSTNGGGDALLGKINTDGTWSWIEMFGGTGLDEGVGVDCDAEGNVFWTGTFEGTMTMGGFNLSANSLKKTFYAKLDSSGSVIWALNSKGGTGSHYTWGVNATTGDNVWFTGFGSGHIVVANDSMDLDFGYTMKIADSANVINGIIYSDDSNNGALDVGENGIPNVMIQLDANNFIVSSNTAGEYSMYTLDGTYDVSIPYPPMYHTLTTPANQSATFSGMGDFDSLNHFGFYPIPNMDDLRIDITPITNPKAGYVLGYIMTYKNVGTTVQNATIEILADANLTYVMASPSPDNQSGQTSTWNIGTLNPGDIGNIFIYYNIPASMQIDDPLTSSCTIDPTTGDETPSDNAQSTTSLVVGPYDPNYKAVNVDTLFDLNGASYLEYEIHFQNLGNAPAQDVLVIDTLTTDFLELASMEIITSSHSPMNLTISDGNVAKFSFPGIMLPDSTSDPLGSMGMVKFRIKQDGSLPLGQSIENFADIYFDYNPAIRTDTATTKHASSAGLSENETSLYQIYPNPFNSEIVIAGDTQMSGLQLVDMTGRTIADLDVNSNYSVLDLSYLKNGFYILLIQSDSGIQKVKLQKL
jgi:hypothetical protein